MTLMAGKERKHSGIETRCFHWAALAKSENPNHPPPHIMAKPRKNVPTPPLLPPAPFMTI